ncbi:AraC family transcriptional regulator [Paenibacillus sp. p3-SID1389]|uniref:AraC family transcriptional regulator n=1 Tax=Paenibacillus sp. p3-SID1389 TaxID=2916364 RepID=UPI0021A8DD47|nr:AraC family transcriptional regulator [Paenibacillus sp. p3-SID1389]MCT2194114.1 AraC family transcriptional regulator [Paenibacillus sp. p3-SID1389]
MDNPTLTPSNLIHRLSPNVRRAWNHRVDTMKLAPRIIFDYELLYMEKGELTIRVENDTFVAVPGDILLFKPGVEHEFIDSRGECWMPHIHFDVLYHEDFEQVPINFKNRSECTEAELAWLRPDILGQAFGFPNVLRIGNHAEVHKTLMQIIHAYERRDADYPLIQKALVLRILYLLQKGLRANNNAHLVMHQRAMELAVTYIMEHYNETVPLKTLSKLACLSVFHFSRIFKQTFDLTPHQFQIRYRMEKAKELMIFHRLSLSTIAEKVGYSNIYSFSKAFKQVEGMSPRQFMRSHSNSS